MSLRVWLQVPRDPAVDRLVDDAWPAGRKAGAHARTADPVELVPRGQGVVGPMDAVIGGKEGAWIPDRVALCRRWAADPTKVVCAAGRPVSRPRPSAAGC